MKALKRLYRILHRTGGDKLVWSFFALLVVVGFLLRFIEPQIHNVGDGFWYLYVAATTIGFGDIYVTTTLGRILTILVSLCGILVVAIVPGVIVSYYLEFVHIKQKETASVFLEKLERLPELSEEELAALAEKVKRFNREKGNRPKEKENDDQ